MSSLDDNEINKNLLISSADLAMDLLMLYLMDENFILSIFIEFEILENNNVFDVYCDNDLTCALKFQ